MLNSGRAADLSPAIGSHLRLSRDAVRPLWSALAIHDTSSVVGATAKFGAIALAVGTTVKLARALWIVPLSIATAMVKKSKARIHWPLVHSILLPGRRGQHLLHAVATRCYPPLRRLGITGLTVTLYLIGTGPSLKIPRQVGVRPLLQGILLWIVVATALRSLSFAMGWIRL